MGISSSTIQLTSVFVLVNCVLSISAVIFIFLSASMIGFFFLPYFDFISPYFSVAPNLCLRLGIILLILNVYGIIYCPVWPGSRRHCFIYCTSMVIIFISQLVSIFAYLELRSSLLAGSLSGASPPIIVETMERYKTDYYQRNLWDTIQSEFFCCGALNFNDGYKLWSNTDIGIQDNSVPDSCCLIKQEGCGANIFGNTEAPFNLPLGGLPSSPSESDIVRTIHTHGCLTIVNDKYMAHILPMIFGLAFFSTFTAFLELVCVILAFSIVASVKRSDKAGSEQYLTSYGGNSHVKHHPPPIQSEKGQTIAPQPATIAPASYRGPLPVSDARSAAAGSNSWGQGGGGAKSSTAVGSGKSGSMTPSDRQTSSGFEGINFNLKGSMFSTLKHKGPGIGRPFLLRERFSISSNVLSEASIISIMISRKVIPKKRYRYTLYMTIITLYKLCACFSSHRRRAKVVKKTSFRLLYLYC